MDSNSLSHTKWNCKYHIVFITVFKQNKTDSVRKTKSVCCLKFNYSTIDLFFVPSAQLGAVQFGRGYHFMLYSYLTCKAWSMSFSSVFA